MMKSTFANQAITICKAEIAAIQAAPVADDAVKSRDRWRALAQQDDATIIYFSICLCETSENKVIGQIFLHDYDSEQQEALVGYHLFQPHYRGLGIGTIALHLFIQYVTAETSIRRLTVITDQENRASQRVAEKCGFIYKGPAREGLPLICYEWQRAPQKSA